MCPRLASVPLTISYHLDFVRISLKFGAYLHHGLVGRVKSKDCYLSARLLFRRFLLLFVLHFYHFHFFCYDTLMKISKSPYMFVFK